mmetsp:Transcript_69525/g.224942  ORF Transcript_69525/g.224942 Transcript_69525/m.224942 type:complete len:187 (-) Transcript_69525:48-608(-)
MSDAPLPKGWARAESKSHPGKAFYFNAATGEKSWAHPSKAARRPAPEAGPAAKRPRTAAPAADTATCHALHLLVKHAQSRRPSSWREPKISLTKDEAWRLLEKLRGKILAEAAKAGGGPAALEAAFRANASKRSDCSSASRGGDLGAFPRGKMQKAFEAGAFALAPQEMSGIVDSDSGVHIIFRIA